MAWPIPVRSCPKSTWFEPKLWAFRPSPALRSEKNGQEAGTGKCSQSPCLLEGEFDLGLGFIFLLSIRSIRVSILVLREEQEALTVK
jgi:hypothetical protein